MSRASWDEALAELWPADAAVAVDDDFDEAFDGDHNIEYWFWNGTRLIPASPDEANRLRQCEEWERREARAEAERQRARKARKLAAWRHATATLRSCVAAVRELLHLPSAGGERSTR